MYSQANQASVVDNMIEDTNVVAPVTAPAPTTTPEAPAATK